MRRAFAMSYEGFLQPFIGQVLSKPAHIMFSRMDTLQLLSSPSWTLSFTSATIAPSASRSTGSVAVQCPRLLPVLQLGVTTACSDSTAFSFALHLQALISIVTRRLVGLLVGRWLSLDLLVLDLVEFREARPRWTALTQTF